MGIRTVKWMAKIECVVDFVGGVVRGSGVQQLCIAIAIAVVNTGPESWVNTLSPQRRGESWVEDWVKLSWGGWGVFWARSEPAAAVAAPRFPLSFKTRESDLSCRRRRVDLRFETGPSCAVTRTRTKKTGTRVQGAGPRRGGWRRRRRGRAKGRGRQRQSPPSPPRPSCRRSNVKDVKIFLLVRLDMGCPSGAPGTCAIRYIHGHW